MTITKRGFICLAAGLLAASLFAGHHHHRPFPHGTPPGAYWCPHCDGDGYNWTWYGWRRTCAFCDGRGWLVKKTPAPPPVVKPNKPHPGHGKKKAAPAPMAAPTHGPASKTPPSKVAPGGPRR